MKILVVEDQRTVRKLLSQNLQVLGFSHIKEAENGKAALELLRAEPFDLVISDMEMPELGGLELLKEIRHDRQLRHLKVLMVTVVDQKDRILEAIEAGVNGYIVKPFSIEGLRDKLSKLGIKAG